MEKITISEFVAKYANPASLDGNHYNGYLYLRGTGITSLPEGLTVGGYLDLENCTGITSLPEGLTVGGYLYLRGTGITSLPEGLTVGGDLALRGTGITNISTVNRILPYMLKWEWRGRSYIKADGIFQQVVSHHGNVYRVRRIGKYNVTYLVTDGNGKWSHGSTLEEARKDLIYKIGNRDKSKYEGMDVNTILPIEDAIECYRVITGACYLGTKHFVENILSSKDRKDNYTINEMIELTRGQYGAEQFANFFKK